MVQAGLSDMLSQYPTLKEHYDKVLELGSVKEFVDEGHKPYFKVPEPKVVHSEQELQAF